MTGIEVTELHTQDGYDWPNGMSDERWPAADSCGMCGAALPHPELACSRGCTCGRPACRYDAAAHAAAYP